MSEFDDSTKRHHRRVEVEFFSLSPKKESRREFQSSRRHAANWKMCGCDKRAAVGCRSRYRNNLVVCFYIHRREGRTVFLGEIKNDEKRDSIWQSGEESDDDRRKCFVLVSVSAGFNRRWREEATLEHTRKKHFCTVTAETCCACS